jgi:hypothetical protein
MDRHQHLHGTHGRAAKVLRISGQAYNLAGCHRQNLHFPWQALHLLCQNS